MLMTAISVPIGLDIPGSRCQPQPLGACDLFTAREEDNLAYAVGMADATALDSEVDDVIRVIARAVSQQRCILFLGGAEGAGQGCGLWCGITEA
jgi:hypothetical protein